MTSPIEIVNSDCLDYMREQPDGRFSMTFTSPPYEDARTYGIGFQLRGQAWVDWMIPRVVEMCRVTDGLVFINAAGKVRQFRYSPVVEWLVADLTRHHGIVCGPSPYVFARVGIPGSGSKHYHRRVWEPVYAFARPEALPLKWSDNTAMGNKPLWSVGGAMSNRTEDGKRRNAKTGVRLNDKRYVDKLHAKPMPDGTMRTQGYTTPKIANPGNIIRCKVGGGQMGSQFAHENEAPFPESLVEFFVRSYVLPEGWVLDPFGGSGTVAAVASRLGRNAVSVDIRDGQGGCETARKRLSQVQREMFV
jgi:hypothetical protein